MLQNDLSVWAPHNFNYVGPNPDGSDNTQMSQIYIPHLTPFGEFVPTKPPADNTEIFWSTPIKMVIQ